MKRIALFLLTITMFVACKDTPIGLLVEETEEEKRILDSLIVTAPNFVRQTPPTGFVTTNGTRFEIDGNPYNFVGTNFWYGPQLGLTQNRSRLLAELDSFQALGINNLRIMVASEGPLTEPFRVQPPMMPTPNQYSTDMLEGLDFLLSEMANRNIYGVMVLGNFWHWSGGFSQYVAWANQDTSIPYPTFEGAPSWQTFMDYTYNFYINPTARSYYSNFVQAVVSRQNSITGKLYKEDPTIMSWQLCNEPKSGNRTLAYRIWMFETARQIRQLDPYHLISTGSEGFRSEYPLSDKTDNYIRNHSYYMDYLTVHIWVQNWGWYDPMDQNSLSSAIQRAKDYLEPHIDVARQLNKPVVLEEFGISRDYENYDATSPTTQRDAYYQAIFEHVDNNIQAGTPLQGSNFWAWGGIGRPRTPKAVWQTGDDYIGDPAHEYQGWYSVYNTDASTHAIIRSFNAKY